ncbi:MAG: sigma-54 dependent transcriptional regulator [Syntrophorhabdales bacterium]
MAEKILIVEDEAEMRQVLARFLTRLGYDVRTAASGAEGWKAVEETEFDLVLSDMAMDGLNGIELLERVRATEAVLPFIIITGVGTIETAIEAIKLGAFHYITKPFKQRDIEIIIKRALEYGKLHRKLDTLRIQEEDGEFPRMIVGSSKVMHDLLRKVEKISDSQASVLIVGESGTGKELLARMIHRNSSRRDRPFVPIDCGALTETLLESELFGHVKGAFTGAIRAKRGLLEEAQSGTVFLDEISNIKLSTQVKLLRAIQEREVKPVGGNQAIQVDVRLISATNRDLEPAIREGSFRDDLYYRLAVIPLYLPPLRERLEDLPLLIDHFLGKFCKAYKKKISAVKPGVLEAMYGWPWKGNIRELANIIERAVLLAEDENLTLDCLAIGQAPARNGKDPAGGAPLPLKQVVEEAEKAAILKALRAAGNSRTTAARLLGISRRALYDKMAKYGVDE